MVKENKSLSELAKIMTPFPQVLLNVKVREKKDLDKIPSLKTRSKRSRPNLKAEGGPSHTLFRNRASREDYGRGRKRETR